MRLKYGGPNCERGFLIFNFIYFIFYGAHVAWVNNIMIFFFNS